MVFQENSLVPNMTVSQNIYLGAENFFNSLAKLNIKASRFLQSLNFNVDPIIKDRLIHGYDDIEITLKNKQLIVDYENNKNKFHIWKNIVYEKQWR